MYTPKQIGVIVGVSLITFMIFLDVTIVSAALPAMQHAFNADLDVLQWVANAMFLALSALMVVIGRVGDSIGRRTVVLSGIVLFLFASIGAACAPSLPYLIGFRLLQGVAGSIIPVAAAMLTDHFSSEHHPRVLGWFSMINGCGLAVGPLLGGFFAQHFSWRWIFGINLPIGLIALALCIWASQKTTVKMENAAHATLPWGTMVSMVVGISALIVALTQGAVWGFLTAPTLILFGIAFVFLFCFVWFNARSTTPLIDFSSFKHPYAISALLACACVGGMLGVILFLMPFYLQGVRGEDASQSGLVLLSLSLAYLVTAAVVGKFVHRVGLKPALLTMFGLAVLSAAACLFIGPDSSIAIVLVALILFGALWSMSTVIPTTALVSVVDPQQSGVALGGIWTVWNLSSSIVLTVSTLLFNWRGEQALRSAFSAQQIQLPQKMWESIQAFISDPSGAAHMLSALPGFGHLNLAPVFSAAFMHGFFAAFAGLLVLAGATFCAAFISLRHAAAVKMRDDIAVIV